MTNRGQPDVEPATQDTIPPTAAERERIRTVVRAHVARRRPIPPLSLDELRGLSDAVLREAALEEKFRGFVAVLINNEAWAGLLATVPYARRLLLLPQCLRSQKNCRGEIDAYGLLCAGCGACPIDALKTEAEALGYVVLVAEGVPVVMSLIESRQLEAVVGASCLEALEKVFPLIAAAAIPGIAIPLLRNGCKNTAVDLDWLREAIHLGGAGAAGNPAAEAGPSAAERIDLDALRTEVDEWFEPEALEGVLGHPTGPTERVAGAWLAQAGKRWRPLLAACAYRAFHREDDAVTPAVLRRVAVGVECFHKASLIHDDIEDHDATRYGLKTLHEQYGVPFALNVGDFLLGEGYRLIAESGAPADRRAEMLAVAARGHRSLCLGQGSELSWARRPEALATREVIDIFRHKTAPAFEVALRVGMACAGAATDAWTGLGRFSEALGVAYQIRDDLKDWRGDEDPNDAMAMRPSILLAIAHERATGPARHLLEAVWRRSARLDPREEAVRTALEELGVEQAALDLLNAYRDQAVAALGPLASAGLKGALRRIIARIFKDVEAGATLGTPSGGTRQDGGRAGRPHSTFPPAGGSYREPQAQDASGGGPGAEPAA